MSDAINTAYTILDPLPCRENGRYPLISLRRCEVSARRYTSIGVAEAIAAQVSSIDTQAEVRVVKVRLTKGGIGRPEVGEARAKKEVSEVPGVYAEVEDDLYA